MRFLYSLICVLVIGTAADRACAADVYNSTKDSPAHILPSPVITERPAFAGPYAGISVSWNSLDVEHGGSLSLLNPFTGELLDDDLTTRGRLQDMSDDSFRFGGQVGYNWQAGRIYGGPRLSVDIGELDAGMHRRDFVFGDEDGGIAHNGKLSLSMEWLASVSLKGGLQVSDNVGVYAIGGLSVADADVNASGSWSVHSDGQSQNIGLPWQAGHSDTLIGYHVGAGVDFVLGDWNAFAEYIYHDLGEMNSRGTTYGGLVGYTHDADITVNVVKVGVNRRF